MPTVASGTKAGGLGNTLGGGVVGTPGEITKVSTLNRPTKFPTPVLVASVLMSPIYQASPNGAFGTSIENRSNSVFGGRSWTTTSRFECAEGMICDRAAGLEQAARRLRTWRFNHRELDSFWIRLCLDGRERGKRRGGENIWFHVGFLPFHVFPTTLGEPAE